MRIAWQGVFHTPLLLRRAIYRIPDKFETLGLGCNTPKSGRSKTSATEENEMLVALTFLNSSKKFTQCASRKLFLPGTTLQRLMDKLKLKPCSGFEPVFMLTLFLT